MWQVYALLSALFAALTAIFAKIGVKDVHPDLATAIRTSIILVLTWGIALGGDAVRNLADIPRRTLSFLFLSAAATGLSWLFYFRALREGPVSRVAPLDKLSVALTVILSIVVLREPASLKTISGALLVVCGAVILAL